MHVVGCVLGVAQGNLHQEMLRSPEDAICIGPQIRDPMGGTGLRLVLTTLPLLVPTAGEYCALLKGCCILLLGVTVVKQKVYAEKELAQQFRHGGGFIKTISLTII